MALQQLNTDFERIFKAIFKPPGADQGGSKDPFRKFVKKFSHEFKIDKATIKKELGEIQTSKRLQGKRELIVTSPELIRLKDKVAEKIFKTFASIVNVNEKNYTLTVTSTDNEIILLYELNKDAVQDVYSKLAKLKKQVLDEVFATGEAKQFLDILQKAGASVKSPGALFDIGHRESVKELAGSAFVKAAESLDDDRYKRAGDEGGDIEYASKVKNEIARKIKQDLSKFNLNLNAVDKFVVFSGDGSLVRKPNSTFVVKTDLESKFKNQVQNQTSGEDARDIGKVLGDLRRYIQDELTKEISLASAQGFTQREGSDSFVEALARGLVMDKSLLPLYRKGIAKNRTKYKGKGKNRNNTSKTQTAEWENKKTTHKIRGLGPISLNTSPQPAEKGVNFNESAFTIRAFINSRLTQEVEKNMGRPTLENRTGRFAQSAQVVNANIKNGQLHMDYTYQKNPYETFEVGGRYSVSYDPRPLIERSIREIAAEKLQMKFTLRRV